MHICTTLPLSNSWPSLLPSFATILSRNAVAQFFEFRLVDVDVAVLGRDMAGGGAVAVFAAVADHLGRLLQAQVARNKRKVLLRLPTGDVATKAFRIEMPRRHEIDERLRRMVSAAS